MKAKNTEVIYQIYPLTFCYAKGSKCDLYNGAYGNLKGVTAKVDYVASLGVDTVWITPFYPYSGMGFGYDITDYKAIAPMFGTMEDFVELCETYHQKGLRVVIDQVYNHCSKEHPWFKKSVKKIAPYTDYFIWHDASGFDEDGKPIVPTNWLARWNSSGPSAWTWNEERQQFYLHSFDTSMPDLNINSEAVQDELLKIAKFWFDKGVDGFRLDAVLYYGCDEIFRDNPPFMGEGQIQIFNLQSPSGECFLNRLKKLAKSYPVEKTLLAEYCYHQSSENCAIGTSTMLRSGCDSFYTGVLTGSLDEFRSDIEKSLAHCPNGKKINWVISSHDLERAPSRLFGERYTPKKAALLMNFLTTLPGSICIYQGDELGVANPKSFAACKNPTNDPLDIWTNYNAPWDAGRAGFAFSSAPDDPSRNMALHPDEEQYKLAVDNQQGDDCPLALTKKAIKERSSSLFGRHGRIFFLKEVEGKDVLAYLRIDDDKEETMLCIYNFGDSEAKVTLQDETYIVAPEDMLHKKF